MAGKRGKSGRPPKPDAIRIAEGTYRKDRHGDPESKPKPQGLSKRPTLTLPESRAFWNEYVPKLVELGIAKETDAPRLQMLAESWGLLRRAVKACNADPLDKDARIAFAEYSRQFASAAAEFGMNPADRARIIVEKPQKSRIQGRNRG